MTDDLELKVLGQFIGTEQYPNVMGANVTDGIAYIMQNGYSWLVTDFLATVHCNVNKLKEQGFLVVKLELKDKTAKMIVDDGNGNVLYTQDYEYTNAKRELTLFFTDGVLMLNNEY